MQVLGERCPLLPYRSVVPWPVLEHNGQWDWITSVDCVQSWLEQCIGSYDQDWAWAHGAFDQTHYCTVSFYREQDSILFLLRFS
jgi:hypothetical protein